MKKFIFFLAALLTLPVFTACDDDELTPNVSYLSREQLLSWQSEFADEDSAVYVVSLTTDAQGDTLCNVTIIDTLQHEILHLTNGAVAYDPIIGMTTANFTNTVLGYPVRVFLARQRTMDRMTVQFHYVGNQNGTEVLLKFASFSAVPVRSFCVEDVIFTDMEQPDAPRILLHLSSDGIATVQLGETQHEGTYTWNAARARGTVTLPDTDVTIALSIDSSNHLTATVNGTAYKLLPY